MSGDNANRVCKSLGFSNWVRVEAVGFSGGIWVMWNNNTDVDVRITHPQFIMLRVKDQKGYWDLVVVYASPSIHLRKKLWNTLRHDNLGLLDKCVAIEDFNSITCEDEVSNRSAFSQA